MASQFYRRALSGLLPKIALEEISKQPIHGYALIVLVRKKYNVLFGPSIVFPMLHSLAKDGLISSVWNLKNERQRKVYHITEKGKIALENFRAEMIDVERAFVRAT